MRNALMLGTFDGVHIGHKRVLQIEGDYKRIAVTFAKSPKAVISGKEEALTEFTDKCRMLKEVGIDEVHPLDFSVVRNIRADDFLDYLYKEYAPSLISCGVNYRFGKYGEGDNNLLADFCEKNGIELRCVPPVMLGEEVVSSTLIRNLLREGEIEKANNLLFEPFSFKAVVRYGEQRGRTIGFPTINQEYPKGLVKIKFGVYAVRVTVDGKEYMGLADIGHRPTYPTDEVISETFIKDFSGDLYNKELKITPVRFLREEIKFNSLEELKNQITEDLNKLK